MGSNIVFKSGISMLKKMCKVLKYWLAICSRWRLSVYVLFAIMILGILPQFRISSKPEIVVERKPLSLGDTHSIVENRAMKYCLQEKGKGCERPKLDPFSAEVMALTDDVPKVTCKAFDWVICKKSKCYVTQEVFNNITDVSCTYSDIIYVNDREYYLSNKTIVNGGDNFSLFSPRWEGVKMGLRPVDTLPVPPNREDSYNVMILVFDSTSHNGFIRKMPKSYKYLSGKAITMNGYNIVGAGTPAALFPILTGKPEEQHPDSRIKVTNNVYVDHTSFIFHKLKNLGYHTAYLEDDPPTGTFQLRFNGFRQQPADRYLRAFFLEDKKNMFSEKFCIGDTPVYKFLIDMSDELDGKKFCFTITSDISHDNFDLISSADDSLLSFMETWSARHRSDTLLIVMGDHGSRFSKLRGTYQGKLEERLPLLSFFLPDRFKRLRPDAVEALIQNVDRVTTPLDLHTTILDVLDLKELSDKYTVPGCDLPRALSLLEPIPANRSCADAGIARHWCMCTKWRNVSTSSPMYNEIATALADYINFLTSEQRSKCERRQITSIKSVLVQKVDDQLLKYEYSKEEDAFLGNPQAPAPRTQYEYYMTTIIMNPGQAIFEGSVIYDTKTNSSTINKNEISRLSAYKNEPHCITATHPHLNPFCYCKDLL
uniref:SFRICE_015275 n=1 Tax=Spodoptera frugiperda TaxID=7108 RepID=A0A2H1VJH0_SPOFR